MTKLPACFDPPCGSNENSGRISSRGAFAVQPAGRLISDSRVRTGEESCAFAAVTTSSKHAAVHRKDARRSTQQVMGMESFSFVEQIVIVGRRERVIPGRCLVRFRHFQPSLFSPELSTLLSGSGNVLAGSTSGRGGRLVSVPWTAFLSPRSNRGSKETHRAHLVAQAERTRRSIAKAVFRALAGGDSPSGRSRRAMEIARMHSGPGRELDERLLLGFRLARLAGRITCGGRKPCPQSKPVSCPDTVPEPCRQEMAIAGSAPPSQHRSRIR